MITLGIETSCDETAASIYDGTHILSNIVLSQIEHHKQFGGVLPELAARRHLDHLLEVIDRALKQAGLSKKEIELIAVASSPGLIGALLMGVNCAKGLSFSLNVPVIAVNHVEAHLFANFIDISNNIPFPALGLIVSGGHTALLLMKDINESYILGNTVDDAIGECFDKVARMLDLPYPGGPEIEKLARYGDPKSFSFTPPRVKNAPYNFSFSGLKTKVLYTLYGEGGKLDNPIIPQSSYKDIAASFQYAAFTSLVQICKKAIGEFNVKSLLVGGGVSCSNTLKEMFEQQIHPHIPVFFPKKEFTLDNAAMIAALGFYRFKIKGPSPLDFSASPSSKKTPFDFCKNFS